MKKIFPLLVFWACNLTVWGQADTVFWFAAPFGTGYSTPTIGYTDRPIGFNITSTSALASIVTISEPANPSFIPITVTVNPFQIGQVDLTPYVGQIQNLPLDNVLNYGLKITATQPVLVEYEITPYRFFPRVYNLKGKKAVGLEFYTFGNLQQFWYGDRYESQFGIVATENNTLVTIIPLGIITGHPTDIPFTIFLNKGQTYSLVESPTQPSYSRKGSKITSNKPIAVNIQNGKGVDQIVPVNLIGNEYVIPTMVGYEYDFISIYATRNNTQVSICVDSSNYSSTIHEGNVMDLFTTNRVTYIKTTEPVYILYFTGSTYFAYGEREMAILPPVRCAGSNLIGFTSPTTYSDPNNYTELISSFISIVTGTGTPQNSFELNGFPLDLTNYFHVVPCTNGAISVAVFRMSDIRNQLRTHNILKNSQGKFITGILTTKFEYPIFWGNTYSCIADYGNELTIASTIAAHSLCLGDSLRITVDSQRYAIYKWRYPDGSERTNANLRIGNVTAAHAGQYIRTIDGNNCTIKSDTFNVQVHPKYLTQIDTSYCEGTSVALHGQNYAAEGDYEQHLTSILTGCDSLLKIRVRKRPYPVLDTSITICDGERYRRANGLETSEAGLYIDTVRRAGQCTYLEKVRLRVRPAPRLFLGNDTTICAGTSHFLNLLAWNGRVVWQDASTNPQLEVRQTGLYSVQLRHADGCVSKDTIAIEVAPLPVVDLGADTTLCAGKSLLLDAQNQGHAFHWNTGATGQNTYVRQTGTYSVTVTNLYTCAATDSIRVTVAAPMTTTVTTVAKIDCHNACQGKVLGQGNSVYSPLKYAWSNGDSTAQLENLCAGRYIVTVTDRLGCFGQDTVILQNPPARQILTFVTSNYNGVAVSCLGKRDGTAQIGVSGGTPPYAIRWLTNPPQTTLQATGLGAGNQSVVVTDRNGCRDTATISMSSSDSIQVSTAALLPICEGNKDGQITFRQIQGGIEPFALWVDTTLKVPHLRNGYTVTGLQAGVYTLKISDINHCFSRPFERIIQAVSKLVLRTSPDTVVALSDSALIWVKAVNRTHEVIDYQWIPVNTLSCDTCAMTYAKPIHPTDYYVQAKDEYGCKSERNVRVGVVTESPLFVPNVFSPNGDNVNDKLAVFAKKSVKRIVRFEIFNRWGERVFSSANFLPNDENGSWDGVFSGKLMESGVFIWSAVVELIDDSMQTLSGDATLIR